MTYTQEGCKVDICSGGELSSQRGVGHVESGIGDRSRHVR